MLASRTSAVLVICVVIVLTSALTATAGRLITSKQIKNNTITTSDIKNGTIRQADLAKGLSTAGPQGPAGAPGTARAYAFVQRTGPTLAANRTKGFANVSRPTDGHYCLTFDPAAGIDPATAVAVATVENGTSNDAGWIEIWSGIYPPCGTNAILVKTYAFAGGGFTNELPFTIIVA